MKQIDQVTEIQEYLNTEFACDCGRTHASDLAHVVLEAGAISHVPALLKEGGFQRVLLVCDDNTYQAAGKALQALLLEAGIEARTHEIPYTTEELIPDEAAVGSIVMAIQQVDQMLVAVGSGTINDLCRFVSTQMNLPYLIVATAPSMDGYASTVAAMMEQGGKSTKDGKVPWAIIGDSDIICQAPSHLMQAGCGDILGKYICLTDWRISHLVTGEYYCPHVVEMVYGAVRQVVDNLDGVKNGEPQAAENLMHALVVSGIAMSFVGTSRPASGSEHHLSHYWEMKLLEAGKTPQLHGIQVGVGAGIMAQYYHWIASETPPASGENKRFAATREQWEAITTVIGQQVPAPMKMLALLEQVGAPTTPGEIGVSDALLKESLLRAKTLRDRYTAFWLLEDFQLLDAYAQRIIDRKDIAHEIH